MAKRFTDTDKWKRPWFRELDLKGKIIWNYLCDQCDHAGIWIADFDLMTFQVGFKVQESDLFKFLGHKVVKVEHDKFAIPSFFDFQYGDSKEGFKAKQSAMKILIKYGLMDENGHFIDTVPNTSEHLPNSTEQLPNSSEQSMDCPSIGIGISKSIGIGSIKKGGVGENKFTPDFDAVVSRYPKPRGPDAEKRFREQIKTQQDLDDLNAALTHYFAMLALPENSWRRPKQTFEAFLGTKTSGYFWRDFISPESCKPDTNFANTENSQENAALDLETEVGNVFTAVTTFGRNRGAEAREWLGEDRFIVIQDLGGWSMVCDMPRNDFTRNTIRKAIAAHFKSRMAKGA